MSRTVFGVIDVGVTVTAGGDAWTPTIAVDELRVDADAGTVSKDASATFDSELFDALVSRLRWTKGLLTFDGSALSRLQTDAVSIEETMEPGQQRTLRFNPIGPQWSVPTKKFADAPLEPSETPPAPKPRTSPRAWGNKEIEFDLTVARNPRRPKTARIFKGLSYQKRTQGDTAIVGEITCVDDAIKWADIPICYSLQPFSKKHRGEIVREIAESIGIPADQIICPIGEIVNKPVFLNNASLLPFVAEFGLVENWFPYFDEFGRFVVEQIEMKKPGHEDWLLDAAAGDWDLDTFEEEPPTRPESTIYATGAFPIRNTGPDGKPLAVVTRQVDEVSDLYNPECVKNYPGATLNSDGSYRALPNQILQVVSRITTEKTTIDGDLVKEVVTQEGFYNPRAYDPNFDQFPPLTNYDGAYGDKTFHRDGVETLMEIWQETTENTLDQDGTLMRQLITTKGWYAPRRAMNYVNYERTGVRNDGGGFIYAGPAGGSCRTLRQEAYQIVQTVEKVYTYDADGTLSKVDVIEMDWVAPESRCDIVVTTVVADPTGDPTPIPIVDPPPPTVTDPPPPSPPPPPPQTQPPPSPPPPPPTGPPPTYTLALTGPIRQANLQSVFSFTLTPAPASPPTYTYEIYWFSPWPNSGSMIPDSQLTGGVGPDFGVADNEFELTASTPARPFLYGHGLYQYSNVILKATIGSATIRSNAINFQAYPNPPSTSLGASH